MVKKLIALTAGLVAMTMVASASVTYSVSGGYTSFNGVAASGLSESVTLGSETFILTYSITPGAANNTVASFPSNENYGEFTLSCLGTCDGTAVLFPAFTFVLTINDTTDGGTGIFTGTSTGGDVSYNTGTGIGSSDVGITWTPTQIGPDSNNATSGDFGPTFFTIVSPTPIVDPSTNNGTQTVSGAINSDVVPEPATLGLMGAGLLGLGLIARKRKQ